MMKAQTEVSDVAAADFVRAGTPDSEALHVEGDHFAAHHIGGTTYRFGSGDEALDDQIGTITLAPYGYADYAHGTARWIVYALDRVKNLAAQTKDTQ